MTEDPKKTSSSFEGLLNKKEKTYKRSEARFRSLLTNSYTLIPLCSGALQVFIGLAVVCITILGLITPIWLSAFLSLLGSISCMSGAFLIYHVISGQGTFESLINQSIRRVISSQN